MQERRRRWEEGERAGKASFEGYEGAIRREILRKGRFIVATNELDSDELSDEEALRAYKEQQYAERGFRFLKDPFFFADSMFLKNESRIVAMVMIMGLALMIHSLAERKLREAPEKKDAVSQPLPLFHPKSREKRE